MSHKLKKILFLIVATILVVIIGLASLVYFNYTKSTSKNIDIVLKEFSLSPSKNIKLGDLVKSTLDITLPWGHFPEKVELSSADGVQIVNEPTISKIENRWNKSLWKVTVDIQPYRTGKIKKERCKITILSGKNSKNIKVLTTIIPSFNVLAVDTANKKKLDLAAGVVIPPIDKSGTWWAIGVAIVAFIGLIVSYIIWSAKRKKNRPAPIILPWALAASLLHSLKTELLNHKINNRICLNRLSDIVRNYLEKRYSIPVKAQTTYEFLIDLDKKNSPLKTEHRSFLREFMEASDLVKFANIPADTNLINNAMEKADDLIISTIPTEEGSVIS